MKRTLALLAGLAPALVQAEGGGFIHAGATFAEFESEDSTGARLDLDQGDGFNVSAGVRWDPGMIRLSHDRSSHDGGDVCAPACASFTNEVELSETRVGIFYAPAVRGVSGRAGVIYEKFSFEVSSFGVDDELKGPGLEGALVLGGRAATFELGGALMRLEDDNNNDADGAEYFGGLTLHAGVLDIGATVRRLQIEIEGTGGSADDEFTEARVTVGASWGYGSGKSRPGPKRRRR